MSGKEKVKCGIEHHAMLFAYIAKHTIRECGEDGQHAVIDGVTKYGRERGQRMAQNALDNGDEISLLSHQAYGEWKPEYPGQMEFGRVRNEPSLVTYISKCAWCEAWKKYDIMKYGKYYCLTVDDAVYQGFCPEFKCEALSNMSWGEERCDFDWGEALTDDQVRELDEKKRQLGDKYMRDFNFHTSHLYHTVSGIIIARLGAAGKNAVERGVQEYIDTYGIAYFEVLRGLYSEEDSYLL